MMTKKDFKELANFMAESFDENDSAIEWMCNFCKRNNPRFDESRFREWIRRVRAGESLVGLR